MSANSETFPPPNNPDDFESLCLDLWKEIWSDSGAQKNGRSGQPQAGVDVFGKKDGKLNGVQCKHKDGLLRNKLTVKELDAEVKKARQFKTALSTFILATTSPADVKVQQRARELTEKHQTDGLFTVEVWSWEKIWHEIYEREDLLRRIGPLYWPRHWKLIEQRLVPKSAGYVGGLHGVPELPARFLDRQSELSVLKEKLIGAKGGVGIVGHSRVGVQGMGGIGKTVLAAVLAHDAKIRQTFSDGVFWINFGQKPNVINLQSQLAQKICSNPVAFTTESSGKEFLKQILEDKRVLIVLDDVWIADHASAFAVTGSSSRLLITTRNHEVLLILGAEEHFVDLLSPGDAKRMLADWAGANNLDSLPEEADRIAERCGYLPLALAMIGAIIRLQPTAWSDVLNKLEKREFHKIKRAFPDYPYPNLFCALEVSIDQLDVEDRERYLDLAVFPEDFHIPECALKVLWQLGCDATRDCMTQLVARSLATWGIPFEGTPSILLHDLQRSLIHKWREVDLPAIHSRLIGGWGNLKNLPDTYAWQMVGYHLSNAGKKSELRQLLINFAWLQAKLNETDYFGLLTEFDYVDVDSEIMQLRAAIELSSHALAKDKCQFAGQLIGRLNHASSDVLKQVINAASVYRTKAWLRPIHGNLEFPGAGLLRKLAGSGGIAGSGEGVSFSSDGSWAVVETQKWHLRRWHLASGTYIETQESHNGTIFGTAVTEDGKTAVSVACGQTLGVWDMSRDNNNKAFVLPRTFTYYVEWLFRNINIFGMGWLDTIELARCVAISSNGERAITSGSETDSLVRVWNVKTGELVWTLKGHRRHVTAVAISRDGRNALSSSFDSTVKFWDLENGRLIKTLRGHTGPVNTVAITPNGRLAISGSQDTTLKLWDLETGILVSTLTGHKDEIRAVAVSGNGLRAVSSGSYRDTSVKLWDLGTMKELASFIPNTHGSMRVCLSVDGDILMTSSFDQSIRIWETGKINNRPVFGGHNDEVISVAIGANGKRAISMSGGVHATIKVWNVENGCELFSLPASEGYRNSVMMSADGRLALWSQDDLTLTLLDVESGRDLHRFCGHQKSISAVAMSADGRFAVSGSCDGCLKVWDIEHRCEFKTINGHKSDFGNILITPNGRQIVSTRLLKEKGISIWDVESGHQTQRMVEGHYRNASILGLSPNGRLLILGQKYMHWGNIEILELESLRSLSIFGVGNDSITGAAMDAGSRWLFTTSKDHTLKVWNWEQSELITAFTGESELSCCAVSSDGLTIVVGEESGRVHFLRLEGVK